MVISELFFIERFHFNDYNVAFLAALTFEKYFSNGSTFYFISYFFGNYIAACCHGYNCNRSSISDAAKKIETKKDRSLSSSSSFARKIERIFSSMLSVGLILLSCTVSSGFIVHLFLKVNTSHMSLKIIWALLVWLWYFVSFFFKEKYLRSRTVSAQMCSVGCLFLLTAWFGFIF